MPLIKKLLGDNIRVGILSAATNEGVLEDLIRFGFPIDKMLLQGSEDTLVHKPDPGVFEPMLDKLREEGIDKDEIVYVGDSMDDMKASTLAGISFIAVTTGLYSEEEFQKNGAEVIISDIKDLPDLILK